MAPNYSPTDTRFLALSLVLLSALLPLVTAILQPVDSPSFVVLKDDKPCLRADFKGNLNIKYPSPAEKMEEVDETIPANATVGGFCGISKAIMMIVWGNGTFRLEMEFNKDPDSKVNPEWHGTEAKLTFNTTNRHYFKKFGRASLFTVATKGGELMFSSPVAKAYSCNSEIRHKLTDIRSHFIPAEVYLEMKDAIVQPFNLLSNGSFSEVDICPEDGFLRQKSNVVPLIIAGVIAGIITIILIGYCVAKRKKVSYKAVE